MHKLESLDVVGFKSFCDKTSVLFNDRITSIVGPNGCGKSNVADAISWVLGEQRPKNLRSDKMEDVIFNGTAARKAVGFTEVSLNLKPVRQIGAPDDGIAADSISVARRLYRSGESEYMINNKRCRLLDIHQTFEGTGLGFTSYAIIEQGRIGSILTSKPTDRRSLIEEAAKIITFKQKKRSAEVKLELAHQNLLRVNDIIVEIERQLRSLKRQAGRAQAFSRVREEMRVFHRLKLRLDFAQQQQEVAQCRAKLQEAQRHETAAAQMLGETERSTQEIGARYEQLQRMREACFESLSAMTLEVEKSTHTLQAQKQQIHMTLAQSETLQQDILEFERRLQETELQFREKSDLREELDRELLAIRGRIERFQQEHSRLQEEMRASEERLDQVRHYTLEEAARKATLSNQRSQLAEDFSSLERQQQRLLAERERASARRLHLQQSEKEALEQCRLVQQEIEALAQEEQRTERLLEEAKARQTAAAQELQSLRESCGGYQHRLASIEDIEVRRTHYSESVQKFLNFIQQRQSLRSAGTLADHVDTRPEYETLVETFLDKELEFVLLDGVPDAVNALQQLRESHAGKCTFLTLSSGNGFSARPNGRPEPDAGRGIVGTLESILQMDTPVREAFSRALPHYANAVVVQNIGLAQELATHYPEAVFVTMAGETWTQRGVVSGIGEKSHGTGLLALKREKRELVSAVEGLQSRISQMEGTLAEIQGETHRLEQALKEQRQILHTREKDLIALQHDYNHLLSEVDREEQAGRVFNNELAQVDFERENLAAQSAQVEQQLDQLAQTGMDRDQEFARLQDAMGSLRSTSVEVSGLLMENQADLAAKKERKSGTDHDWSRLDTDRTQLRTRLDRHREQLAGAGLQVTALEASNSALQEMCTRLSAEKETLETELEQKKAALSELQSDLGGAQQALEQAHRAKETAMEERMQGEVAMARLESDAAHLAQYCRDEFGVALEELTGDVPEGWEARGYGEIKAEFERLKTKVEEFGPINMSALEEYRENEERFNFLTGQRADIEASIADTQRAIQEINGRSRAQFVEAFQAINGYFKEMFQVLFGGGECGMALLDETDALESGIDIFAQPPGKKLQNIMLLSGGEKALVAFALLIAIFKYRPSPFCVLDEVDAPLDEANIGRFTKLVRHMSDMTQFIIITHNKRTMEMSQSIYGITMEEPGVSKVVSVNFN